MNIVGASKIGLVRRANEDRFYIGDQCYIVADGMGGYNGGEIASSIVIDDVSRTLESSHSMSAEALTKAVQNANREILRRVKRDPNLQGMGTTAIIAVRQGEKLHWANVGDSRLYIYREGILRQISRDHSLVQNLIESGELQESDRLTYPKKNYLTRAIGASDPLPVDVGCETLAAGDRILLCSDGLTGYVLDNDIVAVLQSIEDNQEAIAALMDLVYEKGARDNVTIILGTM